MSRTHKHEWMYRNRDYWKSETELVVREKKLVPVSGSSSKLMNRLAGDHIVIEHHLPRPKRVTGHDPDKYGCMCLEIERRSYYRKASWRKHRRQWRQELRNENWNELENLSLKPHDIAWEIW